jgi:tetratricopeptide (TPR) repeat protein
MQNNKILERFFLILLMISSSLFSKAIDKNQTKINLDINLVKNQKKLNAKLLQILKQSSAFVAQEEKNKDFDYIVNFINSTIGNNGEDNEKTVFGYLLLTRHYIAFHEFENADAILSFIKEIKENKSYEDNPVLEILMLHLKSEIFMKKKMYQKAYLSLSKAIKKSEILHLDSGFTMTLYNSYTRILIALKLYREAEGIVKKILGLYKKTTKDQYDKESLIKAFINYGKIYEEKNNYFFAYKTMNTGLSILYHEKALESLSISLENFFINYAFYSYASLKYEDTIFASEMAIDIENKLKITDKLNKLSMYELMGMAYEKQKKYSKAKESYQNVLKELNNVNLIFEEKKKVESDIRQRLNTMETE